MKFENYPLICEFCDEWERPTERRIFEIDIAEIFYDGFECSHRVEKIRTNVQICENCFKSSGLQKALKKQDREIEI